MRNESGNPVIRRYKHLLAPNGRYPERHVDIFWNKDDADSKIKDVEVVFIPREALLDHALQDKYIAYNERWDSDLGNSLSDWLKKDGPDAANIFGYLLRAGFQSDAELRLALEEFAHIEECDWARQMLRGLVGE